MARGTTLIKLLDMLRSESKVSNNPAHNSSTREAAVNLLQRTQEWLWDDFMWPHLIVERTFQVQAGQRFYDTPSDIDIDRIQKIEAKHDTHWYELAAGIDTCHMNTYDSDIGERAWPVRRWKISEDEMLELWPIPDTNAEAEGYEGTIKVTGTRRLKPLVADGDRADLDDRLITLYAAAEMLASSNPKLSQMKLQQANNMYSKLRGALLPRRKFKMFQKPDDRTPLRGPPSIYYRVVPPG